MTVHLRPASQTDAGRVGAILSAFVDDTDWMPRVHTRAEDLAHAGTLIDRGWVTVVESEGTVQGFLALEDQVVQSLYIAAPLHGRGLGAALLNNAKAGLDRLTLWTFAANTGAQRFYAKHGFAELQRTDGARNDEGLPDIEYEWRRG